MSYGGNTSRDTVKRQRVKAARRVGQATVAARPETLREALAHGGAGVGIVAPSEKSFYPFHSAKEYREYDALYDTAAMGRIATALREPEVQARLTHDNGTAPELHFIGKFLEEFRKIGVDIGFQDKELFNFRHRHRVFVADTSLNWLNTLCPIDGEYFHDRLAIQREDDRRRNAALASVGRVVAIPARYCFEAATLDSYLAQRLGVMV